MTGIADLKKILNDIAPSGEYLVVDFTKKLAEYHFGRNVTPRHALQLVRSKLEYGKHVREAGRKGNATSPSSARDAREQMRAVENAPTEIPEPEPQAEKPVAKKKVSKKK